jgi:phospholipid/cholesterol/gamma-HCH transport system permease protein
MASESKSFPFSTLFSQVGQVGLIFGRAAAGLFRKPFEKENFLQQLEDIGVRSLPVVSLTAAFGGLVFGLQTYSGFHRFIGPGSEAYGGPVISLGLTKELIPILVGLMITGRVGSAMAAEIGTMKITEELDALETFGLNKMRFLVVPRVLAAVATTPMLTVFFIFSGLLGGYGVCRVFGIGLPLYIEAVRENVSYVDLLGGLAKSVVFALLVSSIGCLSGFQTGRGPGAVGISTNRSLVTAVAMIVVADGVIAAVYHFLGI